VLELVITPTTSAGKIVLPAKETFLPPIPDSLYEEAAQFAARLASFEIADLHGARFMDLPEGMLIE